MKRFTILLAVSVFTFLIASNGRAQQRVIDVAPGYGSLNDSIAAEGPGTYMLQAGKWYGLNAVLNTPTEGPVSIIGETPAAGQMPAIIQTGNTSSGATFTWMFKSYNDLTLKNVFLVDADLNDGLGAGILFIEGPGTIDFDSVTADPVGSHYFIESYVKSYKEANIFVTNSLLMNRTLSTTVGDGYFFANVIWDTLYFQNNTVVHCGSQFIKGPNAENDTVGVNWINHNTFLFNKYNFKSDFGDSNTFITNNLFFMAGYFPERVNAGSPDPYASDTRHGIILTDTLLYETPPSQRKSFIEYNSNYRAPGVWNLATYINSQPWGVDTYIPLFIPPLSMIDSSRETRMYNDKTGFPNFYCANNYTDTSAQNTAFDPQFTNAKIYDDMDSCVVFDDSAAAQAYGKVTANTALWPNIFYMVDTSFANPTTWPRFNGVYKNATFLHGSMGGLPLGDLNWFPAQKKVWETYKDSLMSRIVNEDQTQWVVTGVQGRNSTPTTFSLSQNYPNPFNPTTEIRFSLARTGMVSLKVYNVLGQEVATLINGRESAGNHFVSFNASRFASGVYFYSLRQDGNSMTKKMLLLK